MHPRWKGHSPTKEEGKDVGSGNLRRGLQGPPARQGKIWKEVWKATPQAQTAGRPIRASKRKTGGTANRCGEPKKRIRKKNLQCGGEAVVGKAKKEART